MAPELAKAYLKAGPGRARDREMIPRPEMDVWSVGAWLAKASKCKEEAHRVAYRWFTGLNLCLFMHIKSNV